MNDPKNVIIVVLFVLGSAITAVAVDRNSRWNDLRIVDDQKMTAQKASLDYCGDALGAAADMNLVTLTDATDNIRRSQEKVKDLSAVRDENLKKLGY